MTIAKINLFSNTTNRIDLLGWNDFSATAISLMDDAGAPTGWTLGYTVVAQRYPTANSVAGDSVTSGDAAWVDSKALREVVGFIDVNTMTFSGLDSSKQYTIEVMPHAYGIANRRVNVSINGGATWEVGDCSPGGVDNVTEVVRYIDVNPVGGVVDLSLRSRDATTYAGYIAGLRIIEQANTNPFVTVPDFRSDGQVTGSYANYVNDISTKTAAQVAATVTDSVTPTPNVFQLTDIIITDTTQVGDTTFSGTFTASAPTLPAVDVSNQGLQFGQVTVDIPDAP